MGNTSSSTGTDVVPQPLWLWAVASDRNRIDSGKRITDGEGGSVSSSGSVFRLPLYRGERNAFLPTATGDRSINDNDTVVGAGAPPPPVLSVDTNVPNAAEADEQEISPLNDIHDATDSHTTSVGTPLPQSRLHERTSLGSSPPTIISSSCDSSYGTCSSTLSSLQTFRWGNAESEQSNSYGQSGWFHSVHQCQGNANVSGYGHHRNSSTNNATHKTLPVCHPESIRSPSSSNTGIFDCIKPQIADAPPLPPPPQQQQLAAAAEQNLTRRNDISTTSLTSLFESCIRLHDDDDNEYTNDDASSGHGSYYESCNFSASIHKRSGSIGSVTSRASASSHNSYYRNTKVNHTSKASLISAFSSTSQSSFYTEQEKNMVDGDEPTYESDLGRVRNYHVVTTAALPWMTGTAVNPLLRAAHLLRRNRELQQRQENDESLSESQHETALNYATKEESIANIAAIAADDTCQHALGVIEYSDDKTTSSQDSKEPLSPCSLDYSCFSASEFDPNPNEPSTFPDVNVRCAISPLGDDEEETLPIRLFRASDTLNNVSRGVTSDRNAKSGQVTLVVPWLSNASERCKLYGTVNYSKHEGDHVVTEERNKQPIFATKNDQEEYIRSWLAEDAGMPEEARDLNIIFYPARYHKYYNSIFALGDICELIPDEFADVCILEEPEHLNWYRAPGCTSWRDKFCHCVGIIHTNYKAYARDHAPAGFLAAPLLAGVNSLVVQANCHRVVKLSGVLQEFAPMSECVENVHGIRKAYLMEGERRRLSMATVTTGNTKQRRAYFIGKLLWAKGFDQLLELEATFRERTGEYLQMDIFGSGPDECEIKRAFTAGGISGGTEGSSRIFTRLNTWGGESSRTNNKRRSCLPVNFMGKSDHLSVAGDDYTIFINPSLTEVLCTTTAEAIAMGKWAIIPKHPSNAFFVQFPNCLSYRNRREFVSTVKYALINDPPPLSYQQAQLLSWEEATVRCIKSAAISKRDSARKARLTKAKEEKTLKKTLSGLLSGDPK